MVLSVVVMSPVCERLFTLITQCVVDGAQFMSLFTVDDADTSAGLRKLVVVAGFNPYRNFTLWARLYVAVFDGAMAVIGPERTRALQVHLVVSEEVSLGELENVRVNLEVVEDVDALDVAEAVVQHTGQMTQAAVRGLLLWASAALLRVVLKPSRAGISAE